MAYTTYDSPVGELTLVASDAGLQAIWWPDDVRALPIGERDDNHAVLVRAATELDEYFSGQRQEFSVPLDPVGTDFQRSAWEVLRTIPYGQTISYGEQARRLPRVGRLNAPHSSLFLDVRMRHRHILSTQLILAALANGGSHACNTTNMIGMAMSAYGAKHAYAGMLGSNMLHQAFAFPCGIDNHALIVRNNSIAIGLNGTVYERLDLDRSLGS